MNFCARLTGGSGVAGAYAHVDYPDCGLARIVFIDFRDLVCSYAARQQTERELSERAQSLTTALSDSLSFNLQNNNFSALKPPLPTSCCRIKKYCAYRGFDKQHKECKS